MEWRPMRHGMPAITGAMPRLPRNGMEVASRLTA